MTPSPAQALAAGPGTAPALAWPGGSLDYAALSREAGALAGAIGAASRSDRPVALVSASRRRLALGVLAANWAGRPALPLEARRPDLAQCLALSGADIALADDDTDLPAEVPGLSFEDRGKDLPPAAPRATALIVSTSGTSGPPRLVALGHGALAAQAEASGRVLPRLPAGRLWLSCLPMTSIGALALLWRCFRAGAGIGVVERFDATEAAGLLAGGASHVSLVPAMLAPLVDALEAPPPGLACVLTGGGPLSPGLAARARQAGWPVWTGWGMTETASHLAACPVESGWSEGLVGAPLPGIRVSVEEPSGRLRVAGPTLMDGYLGPGGLSGLQPDGSFLTSDAGEIGPDGRIRVTGRADEVIVTGGVNVHPAAVEAMLAGCPGVRDVAVAGIPDPRWGRRIVALYCGDVPPAELDRWARSRWEATGLPSATRPRAWRRIGEIPRNAMGKPDRAALARLAAEDEGR